MRKTELTDEQMATLVRLKRLFTALDDALATRSASKVEPWARYVRDDLTVEAFETLAGVFGSRTSPRFRAVKAMWRAGAVDDVDAAIVGILEHEFQPSLLPLESLAA